jgi:hypothetical protein
MNEEMKLIVRVATKSGEAMLVEIGYCEGDARTDSLLWFFDEQLSPVLSLNNVCIRRSEIESVEVTDII